MEKEKSSFKLFFFSSYHLRALSLHAGCGELRGPDGQGTARFNLSINIGTARMAPP